MLLLPVWAAATLREGTLQLVCQVIVGQSRRVGVGQMSMHFGLLLVRETAEGERNLSLVFTLSRCGSRRCALYSFALGDISISVGLNLGSSPVYSCLLN